MEVKTDVRNISFDKMFFGIILVILWFSPGPIAAQISISDQTVGDRNVGDQDSALWSQTVGETAPGSCGWAPDLHVAGPDASIEAMQVFDDGSGPLAGLVG